MKNTTQFLIILALTFISFSSVLAQSYSQDPGHKENAEIAGIKFSVPNGFNLEKTALTKVAFMRHNKYDLALFVAVPEKQVDESYLTELSNTLVSQLFPREKDFKWKILPADTESKVSKFQRSSGNTKGFNGNKFFQTDYITVKVNDRDVLVGYITQLGQFNNSGKFLFNLKGAGGMSMPGWYAQAHILASITGEKYQEINPGTVITTTPTKKN